MRAGAAAELVLLAPAQVDDQGVGRPEWAKGPEQLAIVAEARKLLGLSEFFLAKYDAARPVESRVERGSGASASSVQVLGDVSVAAHVLELERTDPRVAVRVRELGVAAGVLARRPRFARWAR